MARCSYADASYFHNESGFVVPTPYADATDILLSDAPSWLLHQYSTVVIGSQLRSMCAEVKAKLEEYVKAGGTLVVSAPSLSTVSVFGVYVDLTNRSGGCIEIPPNTTVQLGGGASVTEAVPVISCQLHGPTDAEAMASVGDLTLALKLRRGNGTLIALGSTAISSSPQTPLPILSAVDEPFTSPFPMASHVRSVLDSVLAPQVPFSAGDGLTVVTTRLRERKYLVAVSSNSLFQRPMHITSQLGDISSIEDVPLADAAPNVAQAPGYLPTDTPNGTDLGNSTATTIAGLDQRLLMVTLEAESNTVLLEPPLPPSSPPKGVGLPLSLPQIGSSLAENIWLRPTFFQHFDTAILDWRHVEMTSSATLSQDANWAKRQNLSLVVDFTSGLNLYPDLRLVNNSADEYETSIDRMEAVLQKMSILGARDAIYSLRRTPENYYNQQQTLADFASASSRLAHTAAGHTVALLTVDIAVRRPPTY